MHLGRDRTNPGHLLFLLEHAAPESRHWFFPQIPWLHIPTKSQSKGNCSEINCTSIQITSEILQRFVMIHFELISTVNKRIDRGNSSRFVCLFGFTVTLAVFLLSIPVKFLGK